MAYIVLRKAVGGKFALDIVAGAARAIAVGISALNHEAVDYAVKGQTVVELFVICKIDKVRHRFRGLFGIELQLHLAAVFQHDFCYGMFHTVFLHITQRAVGKLYTRILPVAREAFRICSAGTDACGLRR